MGVWGCKAFENDDALDWLDELKNSGSEHVLIAVFVSVLSKDIPGTKSALEAIAAAELAAAMLGSARQNYPSEAQSFLENAKVEAPGMLRELAMKCLHKIQSESELRALWEESDVEPWLEEMNNLKKRLRDPMIG